VVLFHANMGLTLIYGIIIAIPAIIIAGPLYAKTLKGIQSTPLKTFVADVIPDEQLPGGFNSFFTALLPVILLMATTLFLFLYPGKGHVQALIGFIGDPSVVMIIAVLVAMFTLGISQNTSLTKIGELCADAIKDIALILLIIGGSGAFKQVLTDSGASNTIAAMLQSLDVSPLILGWLIAAIIRFSLGSATVAGLTAAGIIASLMVHTHTNPNLMVLSIGAGSLAFSHVNDGGFWMFKEYFNISIKDTLRSWSVMETLVSVIGLGGVLVLNLFVK
jgi:Gnt-I system high-affinity gluconate transporter